MGEPRPARMATKRGERISQLYNRRSATVRRAVLRRAPASDSVLDDACQTAWLRLCEHDDVPLENERVVVSWLAVTAVREVWRVSSRRREASVGVWRGEVDATGELPEPAGLGPDPLSVVVLREQWGRLGVVTDRERRFVVLQALGLSYAEIAARLGVSVRTTERQILRGRRKLREGGQS